MKPNSTWINDVKLRVSWRHKPKKKNCDQLHSPFDNFSDKKITTNNWMNLSSFKRAQALNASNSILCRLWAHTFDFNYIQFTLNILAIQYNHSIYFHFQLSWIYTIRTINLFRSIKNRFITNRNFFIFIFLSFYFV